MLSILLFLVPPENQACYRIAMILMIFMIFHHFSLPIPYYTLLYPSKKPFLTLK